ncbi:MAG: PilZ domain-containing protein [Desulfobacterales bacterium]
MTPKDPSKQPQPLTRDADERFERSFRKDGNSKGRVSIRIPCSEDTHFAANRKLFEGTVKNISTGGIYVESRDRPEVGQEVIVAGPLEASPGKEEKLYGTVVWSDEYGFAIRFIDKSGVRPRR